MGNFLAKLERKWGRYAIANLPLYLIICYGFGYLISFVNPAFVNYLTMNPHLILHGQIWRIFTWVLIPPPNMSLFTAALMMYVYYSIASTLERVWGTFLLNVYLFSGFFFTVVGGILIYGICHLIYPDLLAVSCSALMSALVSTYYVNMTLFLGFAATFPNNQMLFMFIIPVKAKWLGIVYAIILVDDIIRVSANLGPFGWIYAAIVILSVLNFVIFFFATRKTIHLTHAQKKVRRNFKKATRADMGAGFSSVGNMGRTSQGRTDTPPMMKNAGATRHKCTICGQTEVSAPDLSFRFCTKCVGSYEYCENHIFTHTHIK